MYFKQKGKENTDKTLQLAFNRAEELGINEVVVASSGGDTAYKTLGIFKGFSITSVSTHAGSREPFKTNISDEIKTDLEKRGVRVIIATHALSGIERSLFQKHQGSYPVLIMADTLRLFGHGTKVAVEVTVMAADAGALTGNDIIAIGGSSRGADTALVVKPAGQSSFFDMRIREIICKPHAF